MQRQGSFVSGLYAKAALAAFAVCVLALLGAAAPQAAHASAKNGSVFDGGDYASGYNFSTQTTKKYDVTGDGKADTVRVTPQATYNGSDKYFASLKVTVNGRAAGTVKARYGYAFTADASVHVMANGKAFFYFVMPAENGDGTHDVYAYKAGKLVKQLDELSIAPDCSAHKYISKVKASGKRLKVTYNHMTYATGSGTRFTFAYKWSGGKLKRTASTTSSLKYNTKNMGNFKLGRAYLTAAVAFKAYKSMGSSSVAFTVNKGGKAKPVAVGVKGSRLYMKVQKPSGATGWLKVPTKYVKSTSYGCIFNQGFLAG